MDIPGFTTQKVVAFPLTKLCSEEIRLESLRKSRIAMTVQFPVFEMNLTKRGRTWRWRISSTEGDVVMQGSESSRPAAKYRADRALFLLLLSAPYQLASNKPVYLPAKKDPRWWQSSPPGGVRTAPPSAPKCIR